MLPVTENAEIQKEAGTDIVVWDRFIRFGHWVLALAFATLYLEYRKFPLHPYAGYLVTGLVLARIAWGFVGSTPARFAAFWFHPREMWAYLRDSLRGQAGFHVSHNPMGAAMVYALLFTVLANCVLGLLAYSASEQLGPFGAAVPNDWEDYLIPLHAFLGHCTAALVVGHMGGVVWAAWLHRENYVMTMLSGVRRVPATVALPAGVRRAPRRAGRRIFRRRLSAWLTHRSPVLGSLILMGLIAGPFALPLIQALVRLNKILPAY